MKGKKCQIALEFMSIVAMAIFMATVVIGTTYYVSNDYYMQKNINLLTDLGLGIQNEVVLASQMEPGYIRIFNVPNLVSDDIYTLSQTDHDIVIGYKGTEILFSIPDVTGTIVKGNNTIRKIGEAITIN